MHANNSLHNDPGIDYLEFVVGGLFTPACCCVGLLGNALAVVVWSRPALRSSTARFLSTQAVADFGVLLLTLPVVSALQWVPSMRHNLIFASFYSYCGKPLYYIFVHTSVWLTLGVTFERYIMVCWITTAKRYWREKQATISVVLIFVISAFVNVPHFMLYKAVSPEYEDQPALVETEFSKGVGGKLYVLWISCVSLIAIPWVCVLLMNIAIINKIHESNERMNDKKTVESVRKSKQVEGQITHLLLVVTFSFLFFMGLHCLIQILALTGPHHGFNSVILESSYVIAKSGYVINSSLNFLLYCMTGRRFRRELKKMLGMELTKEDMTTLTSSQTSGSTLATATNTHNTRKGC